MNEFLAVNRYREAKRQCIHSFTVSGLVNSRCVSEALEAADTAVFELQKALTEQTERASEWRRKAERETWG